MMTELIIIILETEETDKEVGPEKHGNRLWTKITGTLHLKTK